MILLDYMINQLYTACMNSIITDLHYSGDQFGYYTVGKNFRTYSKLLAIEEMNRTGQYLQWHFNQSQYETYDWTQEPQQTLDELYRIRAQEIRDQYDYVVIWYSGGPDSWNILNTFIKNNIKVDEIAHFCSHEADGGNKRSFFGEEIFFTAIPNTEKILEKHPHIKHRLVDISQMTLDIYQRADVKLEYIYNIKGIVSANSLTRSFLRDYIADYRNIIDSGRRMCFVWGTEKPRITVIDGRYHAMFLDLFSETNIRIQSLANQGYFDEWFYWAPTTAAMVAKQCHTIIRALQHSQSMPGWSSSVQQGSHCPQHKLNGQYLRNDIYHTLIYPGWDVTTLVQPKPKNLLLSERDDWFWNQTPDSHSSLKFARMGVQELLSRIGNQWLNDPNNITKGIKGCVNLYALE